MHNRRTKKKRKGRGGGGLLIDTNLHYSLSETKNKQIF